jgi:hypothetical protein
VSLRIDGSLYPDEPPPTVLRTLAEKVDFIARLCSAWDFGILPDAGTLREIRRRAWRAAVDRCRLLTSPTYHLVRRWHGLPSLPYLGSIPASMLGDPNLGFI